MGALRLSYCSKHRRFFVNTAGSKLCFIKYISRNQRYRRLYSISSQNTRAPRAARWATMLTAVAWAGWAPGPPSSACGRNRTIDAPTPSQATALMSRREWSFGTCSSKSTNASIVACGSRLPLMSRIPPLLHGGIPPHRIVFRNLLVILPGVDPYGFRRANSVEPALLVEFDFPAICNKHILMVSFNLSV